MHLLTILTLVYAAVLVLALATTLTLIAVYLWRIARALGDVHASLKLVRDRTAPLQEHLSALNVLGDLPMAPLMDATKRLERVRDTLVETAEPAGAGSGG